MAAESQEQDVTNRGPFLCAEFFLVSPLFERPLPKFKNKLFFCLGSRVFRAEQSGAFLLDIGSRSTKMSWESGLTQQCP